jgi:hypothetical protein
LCGTAPIPVSSGRTDRHRLCRGGDRQASAALHHVVKVRMSYDPATRAYREPPKVSWDCPPNGVSGLTRQYGWWGRLVTCDRDNHEHELDAQGSQEAVVVDRHLE